MEMTQHEKQAAALHKEWEKHHFGDINDMIVFAAFCLEKQSAAFAELRDLLEQLADIQNGPPLIRYEKEWNEIMGKVYAKLKETE